MPRGLATSPNAGCNGPTTSDHLPDKGGPISFIQNASKQPHAACLFGRLQDLSSLPATRPNSRILVPARRPGGLFQHPGNTVKLAHPCVRSAARRPGDLHAAGNAVLPCRHEACAFPLAHPTRPWSARPRAYPMSACPLFLRPSLHALSSSDLLCMPPSSTDLLCPPRSRCYVCTNRPHLPAPFGAFHGFFYPHVCFHGIEGNDPDVSAFVLFVARCNIKNPPDAPGLPLHVSRKHTNLCQSSVGLCTFSYFAGRFFLRLIRIAYLCLT